MKFKIKIDELGLYARVNQETTYGLDGLTAWKYLKMYINWRQ
jgi:hypothetical protein